MNATKELEQKLDDINGEIERIRAFAEYLSITDDYKMDVYCDDLRGWDKLSIDASKISKDLLEYVEQAHDKFLELKNFVDKINLGGVEV